MSYVAMHPPWLVFKFGLIVLKPLVFTVKKAVQKYLNRKIKKYILRSNALDMASLELWTQCS
jgi:hypothetical protein